jgi:hypothetical protein
MVDDSPTRSRPRFDPRFSPEFQPGFFPDLERQEATPRQSAPAPEGTESASGTEPESEATYEAGTEDVAKDVAASPSPDASPNASPSPSPNPSARPNANVAPNARSAAPAVASRPSEVQPRVMEPTTPAASRSAVGAHPAGESQQPIVSPPASTSVQGGGGGGSGSGSGNGNGSSGKGYDVRTGDSAGDRRDPESGYVEADDAGDERSAGWSGAAAPWRNPYLISLAVIGVGLVCVGVWLYESAYSAFNEGVAIQTQGDFAAAQVAMYSGPLVMLFGAATLVGVLFVVATRWRPRG